jgi:stage II sporulation protein M
LIFFSYSLSFKHNILNDGESSEDCLKGGILLVRKGKLKEGLLEHIKSNPGVYFLVFVFFAIGVSAGAFMVKALDEGQKQSLINYLQGFFQMLTSKNVDGNAVFVQSLSNNFQTVLVILILGITVVGIPLTLLVVGGRGFIIGFTVGFLINSMGWKGLLFTLIAVILHNIIIIPCIIVISVMSISFSLMIIKNRMAKRWTTNYWQKVLSYILTIVILFVITILGSLIEAYIIPVFIKLITSYLTI